MCLTYRSSIVCEIFDFELFIAWSFYFSKQKKYFIIFGSLCINILFGRGGGYFLCSNKALDSSSIYLLIFFSPFCFERSFNKINYENEWGSRGALCIIYLNLFSLLSCNWHYLNGAEIDKIRSAVSLSRSPNAATVELIIFMFHA